MTLWYVSTNREKIELDHLEPKAMVDVYLKRFKKTDPFNEGALIMSLK
jgi:hypothetical protein